MMSPDIQNEILDTVKNMIVRKIVQQVKGDDTSDRSKNELTSVCVRYVMENKEFKAPESANCTCHIYSIHEDPIQIIDLIPRIRDLIQAKTEDEVAMSGENIRRVLVWVVNALGLDFDGCSTMSSDREQQQNLKRRLYSLIIITVLCTN